MNRSVCATLASNGTFGESFNDGGVDNWRVQVNFEVPEPSSALFVGLALALLRPRLRRT